MLLGDDLSFDPRCPPQSLLSWVRKKERNEVTPVRNVVYLTGSPNIKPEVNFVHTWTKPQLNGGVGRISASTKSTDVPPPDANHVLKYLKAFNHGLNVKVLPAGLLRFTRWDDADPQPLRAKVTFNKLKYIGLTTSTETIGICTRLSKDESLKASSIWMISLTLL